MRIALIAAAAAVTCAGSVGAQYRAPRSADYLFAASVQDARALWVNPAGQAAVFDASVMGELLVSRDAEDEFAISQIGLGFNSRGIAFGFRRDRFDSTTSGNTFRIGAARGFSGGVAVGAAFTVYTGPVDQREVDLGLRAVLARSLELGAVLQHIGQPVVRGEQLQPVGVLGLAWTGGTLLQVNMQAAAEDRATESGFDMTYRAGVRFAVGRKVPFGALVAADLRDNLGVDRLVVGIVVGGRNRAAIVGHGARRAGSTAIDGISVLGLATRSLARSGGFR